MGVEIVAFSNLDRFSALNASIGIKFGIISRNNATKIDNLLEVFNALSIYAVGKVKRPVRLRISVLLAFTFRSTLLASSHESYVIWPRSISNEKS